MKCIKCNTENNLKERQFLNGTCKTCRHPFVFDPKSQPAAPFTDGFFANAINTLSVNHSLFFTPRQFYYALNNRRQSKLNLIAAIGCLIGLLAVINLILFIATKSVFFLLTLLLIIFCGIIFILPKVRERFENKKPKKIIFEFHQINDWLHRWQRVNGAMAKILPPPTVSKQIAPISEEVKAYSFDRLVVCDSPQMAQFLLANNFHFEHNCAVLAIDKYPQPVFGTVMEMLRRNPELKVYALHDASPAGVHLAHRLRHEADWFRDSPTVQIYDLGLMPRQVFDRRLFVLQSEQFAHFARHNMLPEVRATLLPEEIAWLEAGNYVELESFAPQTLLRIVTNGIARSRDPRARDTLSDVGVADAYFIGYYGSGGSDVYIADNFG